MYFEYYFVIFQIINKFNIQNYIIEILQFYQKSIQT